MAKKLDLSINKFLQRCYKTHRAMSARAHPVDGEGELSPAEISSRRQTNAPSVHKVGVPPKQNLFNEFMYTFKETFFHDDPLRHFKDQSLSVKLMLGLQSVFPVFEWGRNYNLKKFQGDLIAGLTIASLCIPQVNKLLIACLTSYFHKNHIHRYVFDRMVYFRILDMQSSRISTLSTVYVS